MKNENIIANIEKYVATLDSVKQKDFAYFMKTAETERKSPKKAFAEAIKYDVANPLIELAEIVFELKAEMKQAEQKAAGGASLVKRTKLLNKLLSKCYRNEFKKAFYEEIKGEKMQCSIIDGFYAFMLRNALDVPTNENGGSVTISRCLPDYRDFGECSYDIAEIKTTLKLFKAKKDKTESFCLIKINGRYYNAEYLINVVEILGGAVKMYHNAKNINAAVFESENGIAILMPCRAPKNA